MHSYADRHTHDYFHERDYPDVQLLDQIFAALGPHPEAKDNLQRRLKIEDEIFDKALEKLWIHGGARVDFAENVTRGKDHWREPYQGQISQRLIQLESMLRFPDRSQCRMSVLVAHFGDYAGAKQSCGLCDFCAPEESVAQTFRAATEREQGIVSQVLAALRKSDGRSSGKLHAEFANGLDRDGFEQLLGAAARAGVLDIKESTFTAEGRDIVFRKVTLTREGRQLGAETALELMLREPPAKRGRQKSREKKSAAALRPKSAVVADPRTLALKKWRLAEAKQQGVPAFRILSDRVLMAIVDAEPSDTDELLAIPGIGSRMATRYGPAILKFFVKT
jgi:superfamily II DNA helicase RecQ